MENNRTLVIYNDTPENADLVSQLLASSSSVNWTSKYVFSTNPDAISAESGVEIVKVDEDAPESVQRNSIVEFAKSRGLTGFLHIIHDTMTTTDAYSVFVSELEHMMTTLGYSSWFSTVTDPCNYVLTKYNPRMKIAMDDPKFSSLNMPNIAFTSHANTEYVVFDLDHADESTLKLNESFSVPLFFIIEYFARRRNDHPNSLYLMNQYITVLSEKSAIKSISRNNSNERRRKIDGRMAEEDKIFKEMNVNYSPDNNIDMIFDRLYSLFLSKI